jgi:transposase
MTKASVGIDVSKKKLDVALLMVDMKVRKKTFTNDLAGFQNLYLWVQHHHKGSFHFCMEFTGVYDEAVAEFLYEKGQLVSRMNAMAIKSFARSMLTRTKTDKKDALVIAQYCKAHDPKPWQPDPMHLKVLRDLSRTLESLKEIHQDLLNRLEKYNDRESPAKKVWQKSAKDMEKRIKEVEKQLEDHIKNHPDLKEKVVLLETIPGIGRTTARTMLAEIPDIQHFKNARQLAAFAGLNPCQRQSGSSVNGQTRLSKIGSKRLRKALYMPAIVATRWNPVIANFTDTLLRRGKCKMSALGAAMRKLLHIVFGVLKSQQPFCEKNA